MRRAFCQQSKPSKRQPVARWWFFVALAIANSAYSSVASDVPSTETPREEKSHEDKEKNSEAIDFFERRIRPLLITYCFDCHGPENQEAGLRLDVPEVVAVRSTL